MSSRPFKKVGVLMGGPSSEREVSLRSGAAVAKGLRAAGYEVAEIDVTGHALALPPDVEAVFVALHGEFGEDGTIQALLREQKVPYTGSGPESSRHSFDKIASKKTFIEHGIPTPAYEILRAGRKRNLPLPVVVKPARQGSSYGVHIVSGESEWPAAMKDALSFDHEVIVESFIEGSELTVGIVGEQVLPVIEVCPSREFYDYHAKYTKGTTEYVCPARIPEDRSARCRETAWRVFQALGSRDLARVDFRMTPAGDIFVLELNSIPGFTETSLLPKAAGAMGIEFPELCDRIMRRASVH